MYVYIIYLYVIQGKNNQHFNKNLLAAAPATS